jgi:hypothetical protein
MATVTLDLNRFKASGVYTVEFDASERIVVNTNTLRLVVGFSRKGPFNTPVFLRDAKDARTIFGDVDKFLESRGSFFHRSLNNCLRLGPVYAINLLPLNNKPIYDGGDAVDYVSYSLSAGESNGIKARALYESFYDTERFYKLSEENLVAVANNNAINNGKLFDFVNVGQKPISIIVKKATGINGYDISAKEYYSQLNETVPDFVYEWDNLSEYFVEINVVQGNWNNYEVLSTDPVYSTFFNKQGLKKDQIDNFLTSPDVISIGSFIGCIIPDFIDNNNVNQSIDTIVNNATNATGLYCAINREALENYAESTSKVDMVGHSFADLDATFTTMNFLSYKANLESTKDYSFDARQVLTNAIDIAQMGISPDTTPGTSDDQQPNFTTTNVYTGDTSNGWFTVESSKVGGAYGWFDNVLSIKKPLSTDLDFTLTNYNAIKSNVTASKSLLLLNTTDTDLGRWGLVKSVGEVVSSGETYLKVSYTHASKVTEETNTKYSILTSPSTGLDIVFSSATDLTSDAGLTAGKKILVVNATDDSKYFYVTVDSASYDSSSDEMTITIDPSTDFAELVDNSVETSYKVVFGSTVTPRVYSSGGSDNVAFVYEPDAFDMVWRGGTVGTEDDAWIAYSYANVFTDYNAATILDGQAFDATETGDTSVNPSGYLKYQRGKDANGIEVLYIYPYTDADLNTRDVDTNIEGAGDVTVTLSSETLLTDVPVQSWDTSRTTITFAESQGSSFTVGDYLVSIVYDESGNPSYHMAKIQTKVKKVNSVTGVITYQATTNQPIYIKDETTSPAVVKYSGIEDLVSTYQLTNLSGFLMTEYHLPSATGTKESQLQKILGVLESTNLFESLADTDIIDYRYIIDTFDGGLAPQMGAKNILSRLAMTRGKCLAFLNPPSLKEFYESTDPRFTDAPDPAAGVPRPVLNTAYIAQGGNLSLGPSFTFSLPNEGNGAKYCGVFFPYLVVRENNKNILVPPASDVSNNFVQKFISGYPYSIVAGTRRGVISNPNLVGVEADLFLSDRENLEPVGFNPIITKRGVGTMIFANQTTFQKTISAFNNLHVRDLLITIEQSIESTLTNFLFEFNDEATRLEIKNKVSSFLEGVRTAGGVYDYRVIMDETNNTAAIIDQNIGIIDVQIEPARGLQKIINRITVFKTGGISSGGFTIV